MSSSKNNFILGTMLIISAKVVEKIMGNPKTLEEISLLDLEEMKGYKIKGTCVELSKLSLKLVKMRVVNLGIM